MGELVPVALRALDRGGTLAIAGIHLSDIPPLHYATDLFEERQVRSVTANTRADGEEFLALAARIPLRPRPRPYPFDQADQALADLAADRVDGAAVLQRVQHDRLRPRCVQPGGVVTMASSGLGQTSTGQGAPWMTFMVTLPSRVRARPGCT